MTALFDSFGPTWRPVVQLAAGYGAAAVLTLAAVVLRVPSDQARWVFAGTAAPATQMVRSTRRSGTGAGERAI